MWLMSLNPMAYRLKLPTLMHHLMTKHEYGFGLIDKMEMNMML